MSGSLELVRVDSIATNIRTAADASMNQQEYKPMVPTPDPEKIIREQHTLLVSQEYMHISIKTRKDSWLETNESVPIMSQTIE